MDDLTSERRFDSQATWVNGVLGSFFDKRINDPRSLQIKATFTCEVIDALETGWQSGVWSWHMPGLPTHLVQELNVGTVYKVFHPVGG